MPVDPSPDPLPQGEGVQFSDSPSPRGGGSAHGTETYAPRFHHLQIAEVRRETSDAISVAFTVPSALQAHYAFRAGQYLTLRTTLGGDELRRTYSICSGLDDEELRVAIKRTEGGTFSVWAQENLKPGESIEVMTPVGRFGVDPTPGVGRLHVGFAAGSGITPVISVLRTVLSREVQSQFVLFYGSRVTGQILFRTELEDLKDRHLGRLAVFHVLSRERQDVNILNGRLDQNKLAVLMRGALGGTAVDHAYICGPFGMIDGVRGALAGYGVPDARIHVELFTSALEGRSQAKPRVEADAAPHALAALTIDGVHTEIPVAEGESVLDAGLRAGLDLPFACKGGMCCTCRARLIAGRVEMSQNFSLEQWEMDAGYVLTCQSRPTTDRVALDYDQQ